MGRLQAVNRDSNLFLMFQYGENLVRAPKNGKGAVIRWDERLPDGVNAEEDMRGCREARIDAGRNSTMVEYWHRSRLPQNCLQMTAEIRGRGHRGRGVQEITWQSERASIQEIRSRTDRVFTNGSTKTQ